MGFTPVSYTHLDVYKRQTWTSNYNEGALVLDLIDARTQKLVWQGIGSGISVSYTHLDVYKRQPCNPPV